MLLEYILAMFWRFDCTNVFRDGRRKQNDMAKVAFQFFSLKRLCFMLCALFGEGVESRVVLGILNYNAD